MTLKPTAAFLLLQPALLLGQSAFAPRPFVAPGVLAQQIITTTPRQEALRYPHNHNPFDTYRSSFVPEASLGNSPRIGTLVRGGKLYLSLDDAILLALENNLDLVIARYNLPIAEADVERTKAGGYTRGVNTGLVQNTPGGGVGGLGSGAPGAGAGGTSGGAGGAGSGNGGLVQSTLGTGTVVNSYDPVILGAVTTEHYTEPLANQITAGVPSLQTNTIASTWEYEQAFATGAQVVATFQNNRLAQNSPFNIINPILNSYYQVRVTQPLLAGFGFGPNLRYIRIAKNDRSISDIAFKEQVAATVTQIANIYWDLLSAYQDVQVKERSLRFADDTVAMDRKELSLQAIPALDVTKAEGEAAARDGDLTVAKTVLQLQESLIKNALTRNLDDPILAEMPVVPVTSAAPTPPAADSLPELIDRALRDRTDLSELDLQLKNFDISRRATRNAVLPSVDLLGYYGGTGLAGQHNPLSTTGASVASDFGSSFQGAFNNSSPDYEVGLQVALPLRNRVAKSDQFRSELEYRQAELQIQQRRKQIRIEVRNAQYSLEQNAAHVESARKARDLTRKTFDISQAEQKLGSGSAVQTLTAERDLALADSTLAAAEATFEKAKVELARATGATLETYRVSLDDARTGVVRADKP